MPSVHISSLDSSVLPVSSAGRTEAVTKREAYKNWRLNGEFVRDHEGEPKRMQMRTGASVLSPEIAGLGPCPKIKISPSS